MKRPRRLRSSPILRNLVAETEISVKNLIQPYFLAEGDSRTPITGFTNVFRWGIEPLCQQIERDLENGVKSFLLFGGAQSKDPKALSALDEKGLVPQGLKSLKKRFGKNILLFSDVCLCPYTNHGHCGVEKNGEIENDSSVTLLSQMAVLHAMSGADFVAPSDMMDGRIGAIREALDKAGLKNCGILAYTAKYASSYYGPFREALDSSPQFGDRSSYQMDFRNSREALTELKLDIEEGADMVMVKPALAYLDIVQTFSDNSSVPVVAYSVSGEYQMVKELAARNLCDEEKMALENLTAIRRAGAQIIITYFAAEGAEKGWFR